MNDLYTKVVLTVIAAALLVLVAQNSIHPSVAEEEGIRKVQICDQHSCADLLPLATNVHFHPGMGIAVVTMERER